MYLTIYPLALSADNLYKLTNQDSQIVWPYLNLDYLSITVFQKVCFGNIFF